MLKSRVSACALGFLAMGFPAFAQSTAVPPVQGLDSGARPQTPRRQAMRACMEQQKETLRPQVVAAMRDWRQAHPGATRDERKAQRQSVTKPLREAAREQCRQQVVAAPPR